MRTVSSCSVEVKLFMFQSYCSNFYCSHLWYNFTKVQMNKPRITYNNHRRTGQHPFGGANRVLPEWIQWGGGGVVAEIFRDPIQWGGSSRNCPDPYYVGWHNCFP